MIDDVRSYWRSLGRAVIIAPLQPDEDARHLTLDGTHRVLGFVGQDLALVGHEGAAHALPGLRERCLVNDELARESVEVRPVRSLMIAQPSAHQRVVWGGL
ncbi:hypothetical protein [Streptomyces longhuiensis]|uniref:hypothetical protein n=1 Tax=Streptomyces TaxID=1883 RepID=UPI001D0AC817|nr:hypothetical protein [Streptomyces longhuiensis]UDL97121.1 hypothetical protein LGI35_01930 [Streptomyces longhuiensis]